MIIIVGITLSVFSNNVFGESLIKYFTDEDGTEYSYDKDSIKRQSGKVKVLTCPPKTGPVFMLGFWYNTG
jgi:hypothetical protein